MQAHHYWHYPINDQLTYLPDKCPDIIIIPAGLQEFVYYRYDHYTVKLLSYY